MDKLIKTNLLIGPYTTTGIRDVAFRAIFVLPLRIEVRESASVCDLRRRFSRICHHSTRNPGRNPEAYGFPFPLQEDRRK